jgi:hypothetical protein
LDEDLLITIRFIAGELVVAACAVTNAGSMLVFSLALKI